MWSHSYVYIVCVAGGTPPPHDDDDDKKLPKHVSDIFLTNRTKGDY